MVFGQVARRAAPFSAEKERRVKVRGDREKTSAFFGLHGLFYSAMGVSVPHS